MASIDKRSFEEAIRELEMIVDMLEKGEMPLEKALDAFQKGIELSRYCSRALDDVEKKIHILVEDEKGNLMEQPFGTEA
jgi:exodeoxyribonuclease VII small subunit